MFFFYVDESGNLDPDCSDIQRLDGSSTPKEYLYVLTAISLFDQKWHGFAKTINRKKRELMDSIYRSSGVRLELSDCEVKSTWVRIPKQRKKHPFLSRLTDGALTELCELYYRQLNHHNMWIFCVVIDKRHLLGYMDQAKLHRKAWELLLERIEEFMRFNNPKHQALMICDNVSIQANQSLAMKHAYLLEEGTTRNLWLTHICEMPHFVQSELCNGVQLADLVGYNFYRGFRYENPDYPFLLKVLPNLWTMPDLPQDEPKGLYVFPGDSPLRYIRSKIGIQRAQILTNLSPLK